MKNVCETRGNVYPKSVDRVQLQRIETALFQSFGPDTLREDQVSSWDQADPANNQCVMAALVVNHLLPQFDQVVNDDVIDHYWGRSSTTLEEIDFTRCQHQLAGKFPEIRRIRPAGQLFEGERAVSAKTQQRFEILLRRTLANLK